MKTFDVNEFVDMLERQEGAEEMYWSLYFALEGVE